MRVGIFSDLHGRILLAFKLALRYQRENGVRLDALLQCGDIGVYPDLTKLDKATIRHAEADDSELGFSQYFVKPHQEVEELFSKLDCKLIAVRGNHEDQIFLDSLEFSSNESLYSVDYYQRIWFLKTGKIYHFNGVNILGMGRIGAPIGETDLYKMKYIQKYELENIYNLNEKVDILLTHDVARDAKKIGYGMEEIRLVLDQFKPKYHFHGHTEEDYYQRIDTNQVTMVSKLSDLNWDKDGRLQKYSFGILEISDNFEYNFKVINEQWLQEYTKYNWKYL